jgi:hypothetical protein
MINTQDKLLELIGNVFKEYKDKQKKAQYAYLHVHPSLFALLPIEGDYIAFPQGLETIVVSDPSVFIQITVDKPLSMR